MEYALGMASNEALAALAEPLMERARADFAETGEGRRATASSATAPEAGGASAGWW